MTRPERPTHWLILLGSAVVGLIDFAIHAASMNDGASR